MFERFTGDARTVVFLASPLEGQATSEDAEALAAIGIDLDEIKRKVEENFGPGALRAVASRQRPRRPSASWASIPPRPGSAYSMSCGPPRRDRGRTQAANALKPRFHAVPAR